MKRNLLCAQFVILLMLTLCLASQLERQTKKTAQMFSKINFFKEKKFKSLSLNNYVKRALTLFRRAILNSKAMTNSCFTMTFYEYEAKLNYSIQRLTESYSIKQFDGFLSICLLSSTVAKLQTYNDFDPARIELGLLTDLKISLKDILTDSNIEVAFNHLMNQIINKVSPLDISSMKLLLKNKLDVMALKINPNPDIILPEFFDLIKEYYSHLGFVQAFIEMKKGEICLPNSWKLAPIVGPNGDFDSIFWPDKNCAKISNPTIIAADSTREEKSLLLSFWIREDKLYILTQAKAKLESSGISPLNTSNKMLSDSSVIKVFSWSQESLDLGRYEIRLTENLDIEHKIIIFNSISLDLTQEKKTIEMTTISNLKCSQWIFTSIYLKRYPDHFEYAVHQKFPSLNQTIEKKFKKVLIDSTRSSFIFGDAIKIYHFHQFTQFEYNSQNLLNILFMDFQESLLIELEYCKPIDSCFYSNIKDECIKCSNSTILENSQCVTTCSKGSFIQPEIFSSQLTFQACKPCDPSLNCNECLDSSSCSSCMNPLMLLKSTCTSTCPDTYFKKVYQNGTVECVACNTDNNYCLKCTSETNCINCKSPFVPVNGVCSETCSDGYFKSVGLCAPCKDSCSSCVSDSCTNCAANKFLMNGLCLNKCPSNYYQNELNKKCIRCPPQCSGCKPLKINESELYPQLVCIDCHPDYNLNPQTSECLSDCKEGSSPFDGICLACTPLNCAECTDSRDYCTRCLEIPGKKLVLKDGACEEICGDGYFLDIQTSTCQPCQTEDCKSCTDDFRVCLECKADQFLFLNTECLTSCPDGYTDINGVCIRCTNESCRKCDTTLKNCLVCYEDKYILPALPSSCISCPTEGYFKNNANECIECTSNCKFCNATQCLECLDSYALQTPGYCTANCLDGYVKTNKICKSCNDSNCKVCSDDSKICLKCKVGYYSLNGNCVLPPLPFYYANEASQSMENCSDNCYKCLNSSICNTCADNFQLFENKCLIFCPIKTYQEINVLGNSICTPCSIDGCTACISENVCLVCEDGKFLFEGRECRVACPLNYFQFEKECVLCELPCNSCSSKSDCSSCITQPKFDFILGKCVSPCPENEFFDVKLSKCIKCFDSNCGLCSGSDLTDCLKCNNMLLENGICKETCSDGYYESLGNCKPCSINCLTCSDSPDNCTSCNLLSLRSKLFNSSCANLCPLKTVLVESNQECLNCSKYCDICDLSQEGKCLKCSLGYYLKNGNCVESCGQGSYEDLINRECKPCLVNNCISCLSGTENCTECDSGLLLWESKLKCEPYCPPGSKGNLQLKICEVCSVSNCKVCPNSLICNECISNFSLYNNNCYEKCPKGSYATISDKDNLPITNFNNNLYNQIYNIEINEPYQICKKCESNCSECLQSSLDKLKQDCIRCNSEYSLFQGMCYQSCPEGTVKMIDKNQCELCPQNCKYCLNKLSNYKCIDLSINCPDGKFLDPIQNTCVNCIEGCSKCTDTLECQECNYNFAKVDKKCQLKCPISTVQINQECVSCETENCVFCNPNKLDQCLTCMSPLMLYGGICKDSCPKETAEQLNEKILKVSIDGKESSQLECMPCNPNCVDCTTTNNCINCQSKFFLVPQKINNTPSDYCISNCPEGYFSDNLSTCRPCTSNCAICSDSTTCDKCIDSYFMQQGQCKNQCEAGFCIVKDNCLKSDIENCFQCSNTMVCNKCTAGNYLYNGKCYSSCPSSTYSNQSLMICLDCGFSENCDEICFAYNSTCENKRKVICGNDCTSCETQTKCLSCANDYTLFTIDSDNIACISTCPSGYFKEYLEPIGFTCQKCSQTCKECTSKNSCTLCEAGKFLNIDSCVDNCLDGSTSMLDPITSYTCKLCQTSCKLCSGSTSNCLECIDGFKLDSGSCINKCDDGHILIGSNCVSCNDPNCKFCSSSNTSKCLSCSTPFILNSESSTCVNTCQSGFTVEKIGQNEMICTSCKDNQCQNCQNSPEVCNICKFPYLPLNGTCYNSTCSSSLVCDIDNCEICDNKIHPSKCVKCLSKFKLNSSTNTCTLACPNGTFLASISTNPLIEECISCSVGCTFCQNSDVCLVCETGYFLKENVCVASCEEGFFKSIDLNRNIMCIECTFNCLQCNQIMPNNCIRCKDGFLLQNGICVDSCFQGFYQVDRYNCMECDYGCRKCMNSLQCSICYEGLFLYNGLCLKYCPPGFTALYGKCTECSIQNCSSCDFDINNCEVCQQGYVLKGISDQKAVCVNECPSGYYYEETVCKKCLPPCEKCESSNKCTTCLSAFVMKNDICVSENKCIDGRVSVDGVCSECTKTGCSICDPKDTSRCLKCMNNFLYKNECAACPEGTYQDTKSRQCEDCPSNCKSCSSFTTCTECKVGYYWNNGKCLPECSEGFTKNDDSKSCQMCPFNCKVCDYSGNIQNVLMRVKGLNSKMLNSSKNFSFRRNLRQYQSKNTAICKECYQGSYLENGICVMSCSEGYYLDKGFNVCVKCLISGCLDCNKGTKIKITDPDVICKTCKIGMYLEDNKCTEICSDGYIPIDNKCIKCTNDSCSACYSNDLSKCSKCKSPLFLIDNKCKEQCDNGYGKTSSNECLKCSTYCLSCTFVKDNYQETSICSACSEDSILQDGKCVQSTCPAGSTITEFGCISCCSSSKCLTCLDTNLKSCTSCSKNYYLFKNQCLEKCPVGYHSVDNQCFPCKKNCKLCSDSNFCSECLPGYFLTDSNECTICANPSEVVIDSKYCKPCDSSCQKCQINSQTKCETCAPGKFKYMDTCGNDCPVSYFNVEFTCKKCEKKGCLKCSSDQICLECEQGLSLKSGSCVEECGEGYYKNYGSCLWCGSNCSICESEGKCAVCKEGFILGTNKECKSFCADDEFENKKENRCIKCSTTYGADCLACNTQSCTNCKSRFIDINGSCALNCSEGSYPSDKKCLACDPSCSSCSDAKTCTKCEDYKILYYGECLKSCPNGTFLVNTPAKSCKKCETNCSICTSEKNCLICEKGLLLSKDFESTCLSVCPDFQTAIANRCDFCEDKENCIKCENDNPKKCLKCRSGTYLNVEDSSCIFKPIPSGYYAIEDPNEVHKCENGCLTCNSLTECLQCKNSFLLQNGICHNKCEEGKIYKNGKCVCCSDKNCRTCSDVNSCIECKSNYKLFKGVCLEKCPVGTYASYNRQTPARRFMVFSKLSKMKSTIPVQKTKKDLGPPIKKRINSSISTSLSEVECKDCRLNCESCPNSGVCDLCYNGFYLNNKLECTNICPMGTFANLSTRKCELCSPGCKSCNNSFTCSSCAQDYYKIYKQGTDTMEESYCIKAVSCPSYTYASMLNQECKTCNISNCDKCENDSVCKVCSPGFILSDSLESCNSLKAMIAMTSQPTIYWSEYSQEFKNSLAINHCSTSNTFGISFYLRLINDPSQLPKSDSPYNIIEMVQTQGNELSFRLEVSKGYCLSLIITLKSGNYVASQTKCRPEIFRDWAIISIVFKKANDGGVASLQIYQTENKLFEEYLTIINATCIDQTIELFTSNSSFYVNKPKGFVVFELGYFKVLEFAPVLTDYETTLKSQDMSCEDYSCSECFGNYKGCNSFDEYSIIENAPIKYLRKSNFSKGLQRSNASMPTYLSIESAINRGLTKLSKRIATSKYGFTAYFFTGDLMGDSKLLESFYSFRSTKQVAFSISLNRRGFFASIGQIDMIALSTEDLKESTWYFIYAYVDSINLKLKSCAFALNQTFKSLDEIKLNVIDSSLTIVPPRISEPINISSNWSANKSQAMKDGRLYINELSSEVYLKDMIRAFPFPENCEGSYLGSSAKCSQCKEGYTLIDSQCARLTNATKIIPLSKTFSMMDSYRDEHIDIQNITSSESYPISFLIYFKKEAFGSVYRKRGKQSNLISFSDSKQNKKFHLVKEEVPSGFVTVSTYFNIVLDLSDITGNNADRSFKSLSFADEKLDFYAVSFIIETDPKTMVQSFSLLLYNFATNQIIAQISGSPSKSISLPTSLIYGYDNFEYIPTLVGPSIAYQGIAIKIEEIMKLSKPIFNGTGCLQTDFKSGLCDLCFNDKPSATYCSTIEISAKIISVLSQRIFNELYDANDSGTIWKPFTISPNIDYGYIDSSKYGVKGWVNFIGYITNGVTQECKSCNSNLLRLSNWNLNSENRISQDESGREPLLDLYNPDFNIISINIITDNQGKFYMEFSCGGSLDKSQNSNLADKNVLIKQKTWYFFKYAIDSEVSKAYIDVFEAGSEGIKNLSSISIDLNHKPMNIKSFSVLKILNKDSIYSNRDETSILAKIVDLKLFINTLNLGTNTKSLVVPGKIDDEIVRAECLVPNCNKCDSSIYSTCLTCNMGYELIGTFTTQCNKIIDIDSYQLITDQSDISELNPQSLIRPLRLDYKPTLKSVNINLGEKKAFVIEFSVRRNNKSGYNDLSYGSDEKPFITLLDDEIKVAYQYPNSFIVKYKKGDGEDYGSMLFQLSNDTDIFEWIIFQMNFNLEFGKFTAIVIRNDKILFEQQQEKELKIFSSSNYSISYSNLNGELSIQNLFISTDQRVAKNPSVFPKKRECTLNCQLCGPNNSCNVCANGLQGTNDNENYLSNNSNCKPVTFKYNYFTGKRLDSLNNHAFLSKLTPNFFASGKADSVVRDAKFYSVINEYYVSLRQNTVIFDDFSPAKIKQKNFRDFVLSFSYMINQDVGSYQILSVMSHLQYNTNGNGIAIIDLPELLTVSVTDNVIKVTVSYLTSDNIRERKSFYLSTVLYLLNRISISFSSIDMRLLVINTSLDSDFQSPYSVSFDQIIDIPARSVFEYLSSSGGVVFNIPVENVEFVPDAFSSSIEKLRNINNGNLLLKNGTCGIFSNNCVLCMKGTSLFNGDCYIEPPETSENWIDYGEISTKDFPANFSRQITMKNHSEFSFYFRKIARTPQNIQPSFCIVSLKDIALLEINDHLLIEVKNSNLSLNLSQFNMHCLENIEGLSSTSSKFACLRHNQIGAYFRFKLKLVDNAISLTLTSQANNETLELTISVNENLIDQIWTIEIGNNDYLIGDGLKPSILDKFEVIDIKYESFTSQVSSKEADFKFLLSNSTYLCNKSCLCRCSDGICPTSCKPFSATYNIMELMKDPSFVNPIQFSYLLTNENLITKLKEFSGNATTEMTSKMLEVKSFFISLSLTIRNSAVQPILILANSIQTDVTVIGTILSISQDDIGIKINFGKVSQLIRLNTSLTQELEITLLHNHETSTLITYTTLNEKTKKSIFTLDSNLESIINSTRLFISKADILKSFIFKPFIPNHLFVIYPKSTLPIYTSNTNDATKRNTNLCGNRCSKCEESLDKETICTVCAISYIKLGSNCLPSSKEVIKVVQRRSNSNFPKPNITSKENSRRKDRGAITPAILSISK